MLVISPTTSQIISESEQKIGTFFRSKRVTIKYLKERRGGEEAAGGQKIDCSLHDLVVNFNLCVNTLYRNSLGE